MRCVSGTWVNDVWCSRTEGTSATGTASNWGRFTLTLGPTKCTRDRTHGGAQAAPVRCAGLVRGQLDNLQRLGGSVERRKVDFDHSPLALPPPRYDDAMRLLVRGRLDNLQLLGDALNDEWSNSTIPTLPYRPEDGGVRTKWEWSCHQLSA